MEDFYVECLVAKKPKAYETLLKGAAWGFTALFLVAGLISFFFLLGFVAMILVDLLLLPRLSVEYEYLYVAKTLQIDSIFSKEKRKKNAEYDMDQMEIFAEEGSSKLDEYKNANVTVRDYTSREAGIRPWILIIRRGQTLEKVKLEPDEEMIKAVRMNYPRKVFANA